MSDIKVANGFITMEQISTDTFVGSTAKGAFPPIGGRYRHFSCKPGEKSGILVFTDKHLGGEGRPPFYSFYQFDTEPDGKIIVSYGIKSWMHPYQHNDSAGLMVIGQKWIYVTTIPDDGNANYVLVDVLEMLKYIEGKITLDQLRNSAKRRQLREEKEVSLKELISTLREVHVEGERLVARYRVDQQTIEDLRDFRTRATIIGQVIKLNSFGGVTNFWRNILIRLMKDSFRIPGRLDWDFKRELDWLTRMYDPKKPWFLNYPDLSTEDTGR